MKVIKSLTLFIVTFLLGFVFVATLTSCGGEEPKKCVHEWGEWEIIVNSTCTKEGKERRVCKFNETHTEERTLALSPHTFDNYISNNDASCTEDGTKSAVCTAEGCGACDIISDPGSILPHKYNKKITSEDYRNSNADCDSAAAYFYSCECGAKGERIFEAGNYSHNYQNTLCYDDHYHWRECECGARFEITKHSYGDGTIALKPTCKTEGRLVFTCKCGKAKSEPIPIKHELMRVMEKSATCTATGNIEYWECKNCGNCFSHSDGETEITLADTIISKLEHDFDNGIFIHNDDTHSKICKDCDAMSEEVNHGCVTKKDFDYHWQECECGYKKDVKEHTLKQKRNTTHHWLECSCGFTGTEHEHEKTTTISYVAPSMCKDVGSAEYMCKCGFRFSEIIPAIHAFENGELGIHVEEKASTCTENGNIEYWQCNTCLKLFKDAKAKEEITAGEIVILSKGHCSAGNCEWILNENGLSHAKKCTVCNTISEWEEHVMKTYSSSTTSHWSGCECGLLESGEVPIAHEFVCIYNDDCHKLLCEICGYVSEGEEHSLVYVKTSEYHRLQCSCGFKSAPVSHEYTHAHNISSHYDECVCGFTVNEAEHNLETRSSLEAHWIACEGCDYSTERIPHELELRHNDTHHWYECDCGWLTSAKAHYMSPATDGNYIWTECSCGFATSKSDKKRNNIT